MTAVNMSSPDNASARLGLQQRESLLRIGTTTSPFAAISANRAPGPRRYYATVTPQ
jgi:hypothetical protein